MPDMTPTVVITRPRADAEKLAASLGKKGLHCIIEPMLSVHTLYENAKQLEYALDRKPQAILATSKHAVVALALMTEIRSIPIVAVGESTARRAANLGFESVSFAHGTAHSLLAHVANAYSPAGGTILYARGVDISTDIAATLMHNDFTIDSVVLYQANPAKELSAEFSAAISSRSVHSILFFSQNTARTYAKLVRAEGLSDAHKNIIASCMSRAIANKARSLLAWKDVRLFEKEIREAL